MAKYLNEQYGQPRAEKVKFSARWRGYNNESCDCCHGITSVVIIKYPKTKYFGHNREFGTRYQELWICEECLAKLKTAINGV